MAETRDTEITLGTGKLLGIFFGLVAICAAFFTMGYLLGRSSAASSGSTTIVSAVPNGGNAASKPSAGGSKTPDAQNCPAGSANCPSATGGPGTNLYTAVNAKDPAAGQSPPIQVIPVTTATNTAPPDTTANAATDTKNAGTGVYMVQVAAVTKQEDADILVNALRKKQYPVFVATVPSDSLFHVQVGPFSDSKEAEDMRTRLAGDGYNAIVKK